MVKESEAFLIFIKNNKFAIKLFSDLDFEGMVVDVCFDDRTVATINYDKGIDNLKVETLLGGKAKIVFPLKDFLDALEKEKSLPYCALRKTSLQNRNKAEM